MAHSIKLSDEAYDILSAIATDEGRSVTKQIEIWAKNFSKSGRAPRESMELTRLSSRDAYDEALTQGKTGDVVKVGHFETIEELDEKLGI
jgi:hypothetical protein